MAEIRAGDISDQSHHDEIRVEDSDGACDCSLVGYLRGINILLGTEM
jgi:hypothetical protein